jgi:aspartate kinase
MAELQGNQAEGGWIIQKFGGTSIGKFAAKIADDIVRINIGSNKIAIVCSARSTDTKAEGTTNRYITKSSTLWVLWTSRC